MKISGIRVFRIILTLTALFIEGTGQAQSYNFITYGAENGLSDRFIYTINEDNNGFLWIGTGTDLMRYNGRTFKAGFLPDTLKQSFVTTSYKDSKSALWFGFNDGYVARYYGGKFKFYDIHRFSKSRISDLAQDPYGNILVASQNGGMYRIMPGAGDAVTNLNLDVHQISSVGVLGQYLLIGTFDGMYVYKFTSKEEPPALVRKISEIPNTRIQAVYIKGGTAYIGTMNAGIYRLKTNNGLSIDNLGVVWKMDKANVKEILQDSNGYLWISTFGDGLIRIRWNGIDISSFTREDYNTGNGLASTDIQCVFEDFERNIWVGTFGKGLNLLSNEALQFFIFPEKKPGNNISAFTVARDKLFVAGEGGILIRDIIHPGERQLLTTRNGLPSSLVNALFVDEQGKAWIGTQGSGLYSWRQHDKSVNREYISGNSLENIVNCITGDSDHLWVGTANGVLLFDYEGSLLKRFSTFEGLPYNNINQIYLDKERNVWIATTADGLYMIRRDGQVYRNRSFPETVPRNQMLSITQDEKGSFWVGTYGNGVLNMTKDTVYNYTVESGLVSNYCYSLVVGSSGSIWVGHRMGISRIYPSKMKVHTYSSKQGITGDCNKNAAFTDRKGRIWFGTTSGLVRFDPTQEKSDTIPPMPNILSLSFSDKVIPLSEKIVMPYGRYRLRIDFLGISYRDPEGVTYQYKMENYDDHWSDLTNNTFAYYPRLEDGKYRFLLRAYNSAGYSTKEPVSISIVINRPFWKTWWFILLSVMVLVGIVFMIIKIREQNHIRLEKYLKSELDKRTKEVFAQKEELEIKNKEITDSINYARRIQASILPPIQRLKDIFPESFVFYQPRDIVSGDFYWWGFVDTDRFLIVCADSTGHGVPGAFMSMIGSTLIKDITNQRRYETPAQLLEFLDSEITTALNQNLESESSNDGMDIIILEINPHTRHVKFASAMRPVILFMDDEQYYIRGNRSAIGGEFLGEKVFDDQEYDLGKGDIIYMFSDGYPDQFGGSRGKKLKMVRLKNLLDDVHDKPMNEQYLHVKTNFETWKGDYSQIDDVLFMGIRL